MRGKTFIRAAAAALLAVLLVCVSACALAGVPKKPASFAYAYDFDADVLGSGEIARIAQTGQALESATGVQLIAVAVDFLDGDVPGVERERAEQSAVEQPRMAVRADDCVRVVIDRGF